LDPPSRSKNKQCNAYMVWSASLRPPSRHCRRTSLASTVQQQWYLSPGSGYEWQQNDQRQWDPEHTGKDVITMTTDTTDNTYTPAHIHPMQNLKEVGIHVLQITLCTAWHGERVSTWNGQMTRC